MLDSKDILVYGAGLYSFFNHYSTACSNTEGQRCQSEIFAIDGSTTALTVYTLSTVGTTNMIVRNGNSLATYSDNRATFAETIAYFQM